MKVSAQGHNAPRHQRRKPRPSHAPASVSSQAAEAPLLSVSQVCDIAATVTGKRPSPSTVFRWLTRGAGGTRLPSRRIGGRHYVLKSAALEWFGGLGAEPLAPDNARASMDVAAVLGKAWGGAQAGKRQTGRKGGAR